MYLLLIADVLKELKENHPRVLCDLMEANGADMAHFAIGYDALVKCAMRELRREAAANRKRRAVETLKKTGILDEKGKIRVTLKKSRRNRRP